MAGSNKVVLLSSTCMWCKRDSGVLVSEEGLNAYEAGAYVQDALPELSPEEREIVVSGLHPACWDEMLPGED